MLSKLYHREVALSHDDSVKPLSERFENDLIAGVAIARQGPIRRRRWTVIGVLLSVADLLWLASTWANAHNFKADSMGLFAMAFLLAALATATFYIEAFKTKK